MARSELETTSFDHEELKQSLIAFLQSTNEFGDFNYEGSAINTMVDLLVRNSTYTAYLANMLANESFLDSAQIRGNVVSHAQKLSYIPKSETASRLSCTVDVTPSTTTNLDPSIVMDEGSAFLSSVGGTTYSFTNITSYVLTYNSVRGTYRATDVELFQGQYITNRYVYNGDPITVPNMSCDRSTLVVTADESSALGGVRTYTKATALTDLSSDAAVYFVSETTDGKTQIAFGQGILGLEPAIGSVISISYISVESEHANGVESLISGSTVEGYSNISVDVTTPSYGGTAREDIERIRFIAPKYYQAQGRALTDSDYIPILQSQFPFIRSAISWGGETNNPPAYGSVFVSTISDEGGLVTNAVKQQMVSFLSDRNVGSVTPTIVDPEIFGIELSVAFAYDDRKTSKTFNDLEADVISVVSQYNDSLFDFGAYYNEAELNSRLMDLTGIISLDIDKRQFKDIEVLRFENPVYTANFDNPLEEGSVMMTDFVVSANATDHTLYDENGLLFISYTDSSGESIIREVGTVEYDTGEVEFTINMIQDASTVRLFVQTQEDNFYVEQNRVVFIDSVETSLLNVRNRSQVTLLT